jgi:biotin-(acetyl-CoA carboxylase) ligase
MLFTELGWATCWATFSQTYLVTLTGSEDFAREFCSLLVGMGVNLDNEHPTVSVNQLIRERNRSNPDVATAATISRERFLARTLNNVEVLLATLESEQGLKQVLELYHQYW